MALCAQRSKRPGSIWKKSRPPAQCPNSGGIVDLLASHITSVLGTKSPQPMPLSAPANKCLPLLEKQSDISCHRMSLLTSLLLSRATRLHHTSR